MLVKVERRINQWTHRHLSMDGKITLLNSVLSSLPVYWFSLALLPMGILNSLRRLFCCFLWNGTVVDSKMHLVNWPILMRPKDNGGWGVLNPLWHNIALC